MTVPPSFTPPCDLAQHLCWKGELHEMAFRLIPPGRFRMGSRGRDKEEEPRHWVEIEHPFWIAETPVTQAQYRYLAGQCLDDLGKIEGNKGAEPSDFKGDDSRPVENVNWHEARVIANEMRELPLGFPDGAGFVRLPTEAEWEYACRAGTTTEYWRGDGEAALAEVGWYEGNAENTTHPVKAKPASSFGLYDMHGNVWEWCQDRWDESVYRTRGAGWIDRYKEEDDFLLRVLRGGSWLVRAAFCRSAFRLRLLPGFRLRYQGFRLCVSSGPASPSLPEARRASGALSAEEARGDGVPDPATGAEDGTWNLLKEPRSGRDF